MASSTHSSYTSRTVAEVSRKRCARHAMLAIFVLKRNRYEMPALMTPGRDSISSSRNDLPGMPNGGWTPSSFTEYMRRVDILTLSILKLFGPGQSNPLHDDLIASKSDLKLTSALQITIGVEPVSRLAVAAADTAERVGGSASKLREPQQPWLLQLALPTPRETSPPVTASSTASSSTRSLYVARKVGAANSLEHRVFIEKKRGVLASATISSSFSRRHNPLYLPPHLSSLCSSLLRQPLSSTRTPAANVVDLWWNHAIAQQPLCRVFRYGQGSRTYMTRFCVRLTVDARLGIMEQRKPVEIDEVNREHVKARVLGPVREVEDGTPFAVRMILGTTDASTPSTTTAFYEDEYCLRGPCALQGPDRDPFNRCLTWHQLDNRVLLSPPWTSTFVQVRCALGHPVRTPANDPVPFHLPLGTMPVPRPIKRATARPRATRLATIVARRAISAASAPSPRPRRRATDAARPVTSRETALWRPLSETWDGEWEALAKGPAIVATVQRLEDAASPFSEPGRRSCWSRLVWLPD
ncbi:hypothetical protein BU16DRAFT_603045 [Lophium mytilinum]|uniref:Uncharacterized protein n=1 Tax=Lophium mytilinum TaxID=390894 RepID=A0A6A6R593_9PEZI|nr:hypothetical protein BU16DRAFT_603045 [Lophium mytilinum]